MKRFTSWSSSHAALVFASLLVLLPASHASESVVKVAGGPPLDHQTPLIEDATQVSQVVLENGEETEPEERTVGLFLNITRNALNATKQHLLDTNINILGHEITFNPDDVEPEKKMKSLLADIIQDEFGPQEETDFANRQSRNLHAPSDSSSMTRQGRGSKGSKSSKSKANKVTTTTTTTASPPKRPLTKKPKQSEEERQARYNGYIDAVLGRMNDLIRSKRMDPLRVNLFAGNTAAKASPTTTTTTTPKPTPKPLAKLTKGKPSKSSDKKKNKSSNKASSTKPIPKPAKKPTPLKKPPRKSSKGDKAKPSKTTKATKAAKTNVQKEKKKKPKLQMRYHTTNNNRQRIRSRALEDENPETDQYEERSYINGAPVLLKVAEHWNTAQAADSSSSERRSYGSDAADTIRGGGGGSHRPVRGILHGLSTLRRSGPVKVIRRASSSRIVKAKFLLGPVSLDILPKKSSAKSSNDPTATATAKALKGVIEISLQKDGTTRIRKLRVHPPSSVRFDGDGKRVKQQENYRKLGSMTSQKLLIVANQVLGRAKL